MCKMKGTRGWNYPATAVALLQRHKRKLFQKPVMQNKSKEHMPVIYTVYIYIYIVYKQNHISKRLEHAFSQRSKKHEWYGYGYVSKIVLKAQTMLVKFRTACGNESFPNWPLQLVLEGRHPGRPPQVKPFASESPILWCKSPKKKNSSTP